MSWNPTREEVIEDASDRHLSGSNCAQSVACALAPLTNLTTDQLFSVTEGLGLGMGSMAGTCGAISGACVVAGCMNSCGDPDNPTTKKSTYAMARELLDAYDEQVGSVTCATIKGRHGGPVLMSCHECVRTAAGIAYDLLVAPQNQQGA